ncbi:UNVERIFIED_CONTAM: hypothetical protein Sindi_2479700, partial [Sesamum indicum]
VRKPFRERKVAERPGSDAKTIKIMRSINCKLHLPFASNGLRYHKELIGWMRAQPGAIQA